MILALEIMHSGILKSLEIEKSGRGALRTPGEGI
jgi:hypothetical protein